MDPAASAEACKAAESATNIALVRPHSFIAVVYPDMYSYFSRRLCLSPAEAHQCKLLEQGHELCQLTCHTTAHVMSTFVCEDHCLRGKCGAGCQAGN